jgi:hypothetical protein
MEGKNKYGEVLTRMKLRGVISKTVHKRATIFAKACFGHLSPSKRQKLRDN